MREAGAIVAAGETVFVLSLTDPVWVRSYVSEVDLGRIKPGMEVSVRIDTPGAPVLKGRIGFISTTAEFTPKTVETRELRTALVYRIRIIVHDAGDILRQGMPVTVSVLDAVRKRRRHPAVDQHCAMTEPLVIMRRTEQALRSRGAGGARRITATIRAGQVTGLVGPDGAGKTTLMRLDGGAAGAQRGQPASVCGLRPSTEAERAA